MSISLSLVWTNASNFVRDKLAAGLTPLQKKIAIFAAALFACILIYRCCYSIFWKKKPLTVQEKLGKNQKFALAQQQNESPKAFTLIPGDIPESLEFKIHDPKQPKNFLMERRDLNGKEVVIGERPVGIASCKGSRETMEDADLATTGSIELKDGSHPFELYGVFDGHGGAEASSFVKKNLARYLLNELEQRNRDGLTDEGIYHALKACCIKLDADYVCPEGMDDGTTAAIALILDGKIWIANVGDSRTILIKDGKPLQASEDAKPHIERYLAKIKKLRGNVSSNRVNGILAVARAIGDKKAKGIFRRDDWICKSHSRKNDLGKEFFRMLCLSPPQNHLL